MISRCSNCKYKGDHDVCYDCKHDNDVGWGGYTDHSTIPATHHYGEEEQQKEKAEREFWGPWYD